MLVELSVFVSGKIAFAWDEIVLLGLHPYPEIVLAEPAERPLRLRMVVHQIEPTRQLLTRQLVHVGKHHLAVDIRVFV